MGAEATHGALLAEDWRRMPPDSGDAGDDEESAQEGPPASTALQAWAAEADVQGLAAHLGLRSVPEADYRVLFQFVRLKHAWPARVQVENQA